MAFVTLVRPPSAVSRYALTVNATPPLSLAYLAGALTSAGHEVQIIDAVGESLDQAYAGYRPHVVVNGLTTEEIVARIDPRSDVVGVSCLFSNEWPLVRELIGAIAAAAPGRPIIFGGEHASAVPERSLRAAPAISACVLGEGEETAIELVAALVSGSDLAEVRGIAYLDARGLFRKTGPRTRVRDVDGIAAPRWDLVPIEAYLAGGHSFGVDRGRTLPILATRGCPYRCTFCSSPQMWTTRYVAREPALVVDEIERWVRDYRIDAVDFYDLTAIIKRDWILEFCRLLRQRRLSITWQLPSGTRSEALDRGVLRAMVAAGCRNVSYAPESGSPRTLERILKKVSLPRMEESMRAAVDVGLNVKANIMIGFPGETYDDLAETLRFMTRMARIGVHDASVWTFAPYPGSQLFDELLAAGRIGELNDDYYAGLLSYSDLVSAVSYNEQMSSRVLEWFRVAAMALFYSTSYASHPSRPITLARNALRGRYESRMEMSLGNLIRRVRRSAAPAA